MNTFGDTSATQARANDTPTAAGRYLTLAVHTAGLRCLVVGGGRVGTRKALKLADAGAAVTVLAPEITGRLRRAVRLGRVHWRQAEYDPAELDDFLLVVAATSDAALNLRIGRDCEVRGSLSCVASSATSSRVIFPAEYDDGEITVAVHSRGRECRRSQQLRDDIAAELRRNRAAGQAGIEPIPRPLTPGPSPRRRGEGSELAPRPLTSGPSPRRRGEGRTFWDRQIVYLVGAGPGAPDLISVRGYRAVRCAEVVLADRLVPRTFLEELGIPAAGKTIRWLEDGARRWSQAEINRWLVRHARAGKVVARLKGGDPFVFGRGDAEIDYLSEQGVPWEVIPGCSSATAVPTAAGLPLTRHGQAHSFAVATARVCGGAIAGSFPRADSLVILMGAGVLDQVVARLLADGWPADTPAAVVERGTLAWERRVAARLSQLGSAAEDAGVGPPAVIVVGNAACTGMGSRRRRILFTGLDPADVRGWGEVLHWPALWSWPEAELASPHPELGRPLPAYDVICFTAPAGVRAYWTTYGAAAFQGEVWCLDAATRRTLARHGIRARLVTPRTRSMPAPLRYGPHDHPVPPHLDDLDRPAPLDDLAVGDHVDERLSEAGLAAGG